MRYLVLAGLVGAAIFPATAGASTVAVEDGWSVFRSGPVPSDVTATDRPFPLTSFTDGYGPITAGQGCAPGDPVVCSAKNIRLVLGGGNDRGVAGVETHVQISGADGDDDIGAFGQDNVVSAGAGDDMVMATSNGSSTVHGGPGSDVVYGREIDPRLYGDSGDDFLYTGAGPFIALDGGGDDDTLVSTSGRMLTGSMAGGGGDDLLEFLPGEPDSRADRWTLDGSAGADTIVGSRGPDQVSGGPGGDHIDVSGDEQADTVDCGGGFDTVYADPEDTVASDCELRYDGPMPTSWAMEQAIARAQALPDEMVHLLYDPRP